MTRLLVILIFLAALGIGGYFLYTKVIKPELDKKDSSELSNENIVSGTQDDLNNGSFGDVPVDLLTTLNKNPDLSKFKEAIDKVGKNVNWEANAEYTFFIPDNTAFNALGTDKLNELFSTENQDELAELIQIHVVKGKTSTADLLGKEELENISGENISVKIENGAFMIEDSLLKTPDIVSNKIVVHVVEKVIE
jgi:uncharacterized surface protein with fasciclin (FAS1) repeats